MKFDTEKGVSGSADLRLPADVLSARDFSARFSLATIHHARDGKKWRGLEKRADFFLQRSRFVLGQKKDMSSTFESRGRSLVILAGLGNIGCLELW